MDGTKKRGQGKHDPAGLTKLKIIEYVYNHVSGAPTPDITGVLRKECNISGPRVIRKLLTSLEKKHYIKGIHGSGIESVWYPSDNGDHVQELLSDGKLWSASRLKKKPVEEIVIRLQMYGDTVVTLFNTQFFNDVVKPQLIQTFCSSPPFLEECNEKFFMNLKRVRKSKKDEMVLRELFNKSLSQSPAVMLHMYFPSPLIRAGLFAMQMDPRIYAKNALLAFQENPDQYPLTADQLNNIRKLAQSGETAPAAGNMFSSVEAFGLASVYLGLNIDHIQFPHLQEKIDPILSDRGTNALLDKYLPNENFLVETTKFLITLAAVWGAFTPEK